MDKLKNFIESGVLESYVMGTATQEETDLVEHMAMSFQEVRDELSAIGEAMEAYAFANEIAPDATIKPFLLATIDYTSRLQNGEAPGFPPQLDESTRITDFTPWLERDDMMLPGDFTDFHAKIIGYTPAVITAIVWIKEMAPQETHDKEYEKFLIVEGTCDITIENQVYRLVPGDYLSIPLHKAHHVTVTSMIPCKVILQRIAA